MLVIIDGLHGDDSDEIVRICNNTSLDTKVLHNPTNQGAAAARNLGLKESQGDLVGFLDSDDYWDQRFLEEHIIAHKIFPNCSVISCYYKGKNKKDYSRKSLKEQYHYRNFVECLLLQRLSTPCTTIKANRSYDFFDTRLQYAEDLKFFLTNIYLFKKKSILINKELVFLGRPPGSKGGLSENIFEMHKNAQDVYLEIYKKFDLTIKEKMACFARMTYHRFVKLKVSLLNCLTVDLKSSI